MNLGDRRQDADCWREEVFVYKGRKEGGKKSKEVREESRKENGLLRNEGKKRSSLI